MKFDRIKLIARLDEIQEASRAEFDAAQAPQIVAYDKAIKEWKDVGGKRLAEALRRVAKRAAEGGLVTSNDVQVAVEKARGNDDLFWNGAKDPSHRYRRITERPSGQYKPNAKYAALRKVLEACPDEFVTTTMLREFGFSPSMFLAATA